MNQYTSFYRVTVLGPKGAIIVLQNVPEVAGDGTLRQGTVAQMLSDLPRFLQGNEPITNVLMEEHQLEGDYKVRTMAEHLTDEGLAYALASILDWKHPSSLAPISYTPGEGLIVRNEFSITNLDNAFLPFDPVVDLEACMAILLAFKVNIRFDDRSGAALFYNRDTAGGPGYLDPIDIRRHICISAINGRSAFVDSKWDGTVPRSMVKEIVQKSFADTERT